MVDFIELGLDMKHIVVVRSVSEMVVFSACNWLNWSTSWWWWLYWQHVVKIKSAVRTRASASRRRTTTVTDEITAKMALAQTSQRTAVSDCSVLYSAVSVVEWLARLTAVREDPGSNHAADSVYRNGCCDIQSWARAVHLYCSAYVDSALHPSWDGKMSISLRAK